MKRWIRQYIYSVAFLHICGESAWPGNVRFVWKYVGSELMRDNK